MTTTKKPGWEKRKKKKIQFFLEEKLVPLTRHCYYLSSLGYQTTTCFTHTSLILLVITWVPKDNLLHSHVTMVTRSPHPRIKGQCVLLAHHHGYLSVPAHQRTTCFTHTSPWLPDLTHASKDNLLHSHVTMVTCPHLGIKGQPVLPPCHHGYLSSPGHQRTTCFTHTSPWLPVMAGHQRTACFAHILPWLPVLTWALKENLDTGMFSGPPWTSKCLQPALAST